MRALFATFPRGWAGAGLFLLRAVAGVSAVIDGSRLLSSGATPSLLAWAEGAALIVFGGALVAGLLTPIAAFLLSVNALGIALGWIAIAPPGPTGSLQATLFLVAMSATVALAGPGAYSIDARLFGRREIAIPPASRY